MAVSETFEPSNSLRLDRTLQGKVQRNTYFLRLCLSFSLVSGGIESLPFFKVPLFIFERLGNILPDQNYFTGHVGTSRRLLSEEYLRIFPWGVLTLRFFSFQQEMVPEEHFSRDPDPDSIYRFISPFFSATQLRAEYAITTLVS